MFVMHLFSDYLQIAKNPVMYIGLHQIFSSIWNIYFIIYDISLCEIDRGRGR